jgi:hypothetical protein
VPKLVDRYTDFAIVPCIGARAADGDVYMQLFRFADSSAATYQKETAIATAAAVANAGSSSSSSNSSSGGGGIVFTMLGEGDDSSLFRASPANVSVIYQTSKVFNQNIANLLGSRYVSQAR